MAAPTSEQIVSLRESEQIVDSLNEAIELEGEPDDRIKFLLMRLRTLLKRDGRAALAVLEDLNRQPAPIIGKRILVRPDWDRREMNEQQLQDLWDDSPQVAAVLLKHILANLRMPFTISCAEDMKNKAWFQETLYEQHLKPHGYVDVLLSAWAASAQRAVYVTLLRKDGEPPFTDHDRNLMSLMLRALAPLADRELLRPEATRDHPKISERQREILHLLLAGDSEKEIAHRLSRSINTVHTHIRQLYDAYSVSSRGQLMAYFVDRTIVSSMASG